jgi:hypothetical protein
LSKDVSAAVEAYRNRDEEGSTRFY